MKSKKSVYLIVVITAFGILYSLISLVNHYFFRSFTLDLGAYTNALYDYIHFQWNDSSVFKQVNENLLADHFDLYLMIFSPLSLIFKTYTLLIVQIVSLLFGGYGVYRYFSLSKDTSSMALPATIYFYLFFGVYSALSFDYHSNVVAAAIVPWFFYFFKKKNYLASGLVLILMLVSKENISLWAAFICLGLIFEYWKDRKQVYYLLFFLLLSVSYFVLITNTVMPAISNSGEYPHLRYSYFGNSSADVLKYLLSNPIDSFKVLFLNHTGDPLGDYVKLELHILLLVSGLYLLFLKPYYILMLVPIYFQKLYNDSWGVWGTEVQYSIEFAPIFAIGIFSVLAGWKSERLKKIFTFLVIGGALISTVRVMDYQSIWTDKGRIRFYQGHHYRRSYDVEVVYEQLNQIPDDAVVSAQSPILPHLALRDNIYQFPMVKDAEYIIYTIQEGTYPLSLEDFLKEIEKIRNSGEWEVQYEDANITVLKRKSP
jgi:uncharacterized membrane protein